MDASIQELLQLIIEYYGEHTQYYDQYEVQALRDAAESGIDALHTMCRKIWGTHTCTMYMTVLDSIQGYCEFILENYGHSTLLSMNDIDAIVEFTKRRKRSADLLHSVLLAYESRSQMETLTAQHQEILSASDQIIHMFST